MKDKSNIPQGLIEEGLRYVSDSRPGITRQSRGKSFVYLDAHGKRISDPQLLARIRSIGMPPAYRSVWISPSANGHIQATGLDNKGRKQYRYHPRWIEIRDEQKFAHMLAFGAKLPSIRKQVARDLTLPTLSRKKVLAAVVGLLDKTLIRVGNEEYAKANGSYGLTTLRRKHVAIEGAKIIFEFTGKSGKTWQLSLNDRRIASVVRRCTELPGYELFKYVNETGEKKEIDSEDVNAYLREICGADFTAKDFRTWAGTVLAAVALAQLEAYDSETQAKRNMAAAIKFVASRLGNTAAICRKCYVHPELLKAYLDKSLDLTIQAASIGVIESSSPKLSKIEKKVLSFLRRRIKES
jgi:DNA topoisomerase I